jgi:hypothetical protein
VGKVLADANVFGRFAVSDDVVSPFDAGVVVLVNPGRLLLGEAHALDQVAEILDFRGRRGR